MQNNIIDQGFLELSYKTLEERNLSVKRDRAAGKDEKYFKEKVLDGIQKETGIKAVIVAFSDMEGKLHMLDYNKDFFIDAYDNLTFDGSSIRGFSKQRESDLRLKPDWSSFRWLPADVFGKGKVLIFSGIRNQDGSSYPGDFRGNLVILLEEMKEKGIMLNAAPEIEGFLLEGVNAEQYFNERVGFKLASEGGYFNSLPQDHLRQFIDKCAEVTRAMAFENEKDHPEVAPSQFELNYKYTDIVQASDQILIYKLIARQIAKNMNCTATFLPKPIMKINGSGMHSNMSISKEGKNLFYDPNGKYGISKIAHDFLTGILYHANDLCLTINSSVNSYRRLDPHYEAPNEIKVSSADRSAMIRVPIGNEKSSRIEVRSLPPDCNPYLAHLFFVKAGLEVMNASESEKKQYYDFYNQPTQKLPSTIGEAIDYFKNSAFINKIMGDENAQKYLELKQMAADRAPRELGSRIKTGEVWYHHEVTNQMLWNRF
ncbi:glutamine synthetase [Candidatus Peregrinibacteria bacterium CG_4_10_14_0_2_um_filter_43_11]|nr:MAG: glutamine synthetase [Candidatus Peregrinibacteria bacterium CG_4_10_14_0_2_um_filter_43_11]